MRGICLTAKAPRSGAFLLQCYQLKAMLDGMKSPLLKYFLVMVIIYSSAISAGLYKGLDEEGNVIYSDKPFENSELFTPPTLTIMDAPKVPPKKEVVEEEKVEETKYTKFSISAPVNDQTIWNEPNLMVSLKLTPDLNISEGHTTWLLMDGKPIVKNSQSLLLQIGRSDRGQHTLQAQVRNKKGKIIKQTKPVTVHIKNSVVKRQPR
jgi:hypothetical protein